MLHFPGRSRYADIDDRLVRPVPKSVCAYDDSNLSNGPLAMWPQMQYGVLKMKRVKEAR